MGRLRKGLHYIDLVSENVGKGVAFLCAFMMLIVTYEVVTRYIFRSPTPWAFETNTFLLCAYSALGGAYTLLYRGHVNVDLVYRRFGTRTKALTDILTSVLFFAFVYVLIWKSWALAWDALEIGERSADMEIPLFPIKVLIPIGGGLIFLQGLVLLVRSFITLITGVEERKEVPGLFVPQDRK